MSSEVIKHARQVVNSELGDEKLKNIGNQFLDVVEQKESLQAENARLREEKEKLTKLNEDKFNTIQAYCKAASEDKAEIAKLKAIVDRLLKYADTGNPLGMPMRCGLSLKANPAVLARGGWKGWGVMLKPKSTIYRGDNGKFGIACGPAIMYEADFDTVEEAKAIIAAHDAGAKTYDDAVAMIAEAAKEGKE